MSAQISEESALSLVEGMRGGRTTAVAVMRAASADQSARTGRPGLRPF
jgi:hypothetical protein